jgi:hypothetical protein
VPGSHHQLKSSCTRDSGRCCLNNSSGKSGGREMFERCLEGATKQDHVCAVWPVYPASAWDAKSVPVGWRTQCGRHVSVGGLG